MREQEFDDELDSQKPVKKKEKKVEPKPIVLKCKDYVPIHDIGATKSAVIFGEGDDEDPKAFSFGKHKRFHSMADETSDKRFVPVQWTEQFSKTKRVVGVDFDSCQAHNLDEFLIRPVHNDNLDTRRLEVFKYQSRLDKAMRFNRRKRGL